MARLAHVFPLAGVALAGALGCSGDPGASAGPPTFPEAALMSLPSDVITDVELFMPGQWVLRTSIAGGSHDGVTPSFEIP
jgi:hypothetical protein